jgi:hypothetical protein
MMGIPNQSNAAHYGTIYIGELALDAAVLESGERGFIQRQLMQSIGLEKKTNSARFRHVLSSLSEESLNIFDDSVRKVRLPEGRKPANWVSYQILPTFISAVIHSALKGTLHPQRQHWVTPCLDIQSALAEVGVIALIDDATGYREHREPDALQEIFDKLMLMNPASWMRRFLPEFYEALFQLFGWEYSGHQGGTPAIIGKITEKWVYQQVFPVEVYAELKERRKNNKLHQSLTEDALRLLERQIGEVTGIAKSAYSFKDFESRCATAFCKNGHQLSLWMH